MSCHCGITDYAKVRADSLSGGQQQRLTNARSLMQNAKLLLADEPVASLDPETSNSVMQYFEKTYGGDPEEAKIA